MGHVIDFRTKSDGQGTSSRDGNIIAEALYLASMWIEAQPQNLRNESNRKNMLTILEVAFPSLLEAFREQDALRENACQEDT